MWSAATQNLGLAYSGSIPINLFKLKESGFVQETALFLAGQLQYIIPNSFSGSTAEALFLVVLLPQPSILVRRTVTASTSYL